MTVIYLVLALFMKTYRPYSCADVIAKLGGTYSKEVVQETLDWLTRNGVIQSEIYGNQTLYMAKPEEVNELDVDMISKTYFFYTFFTVVGIT